jgi:hypothetical protein
LWNGYRQGEFPDMQMTAVSEANKVAGPHVADGVTVYHFDPLEDPRWEEFLNRAPAASVFHSTAWLEALRRTYGYRPVAYSTSSPDERLQNALVFCRVESWLTGRRLVSLPFSDHCEFLVHDEFDSHVLFQELEKVCRDQKWRYFEIRPLKALDPASPLPLSTTAYSFHKLDLAPTMDSLFRGFHKNSTQRKIRRAEREGLQYCEGGRELLDDFYRLLVITRRRHRIPPQPRKWFESLLECFGDALKIRLALKQGAPVAGMLTLRYKDTLTYKYGGSETEHHGSGTMHLLFWKSIQEAKNAGLRWFDFGRTNEGQEGLITFKGRWGATQSDLIYYRYAPSGSSAGMLDPAGDGWKARAAQKLFAHAPRSLLSTFGAALYKHVG